MTFPPSTMRSILLDYAAPGGLAFRDVDMPRPGSHEALVRVAAVSLDGEEVRHAMTSRSEGARLGSDLAGTVVAAATDGSGPSAGSRVAGLVRSGAWAQFVAVPSDALAVLPSKVSFAQAAALPAAGLTALHGLGHGGLLAAKRVLITCGTGGVGLYAVQLAHLSGARVTATLGDPEHEALMEEYGADHVIVGDVRAAGEFGPYHLVMAAVGGTMLERALDFLRTGGACVLYETAEAHAATIDERAFVERGARLQGVVLFDEVRREPAAEGLHRLLSLVAANALQPHVEFEASWTEISALSRQILDRNSIGRAVLQL